MTTSQQPRRTALITGASSGIGHELARVLGRASYDLVLVARNKMKLEEVAASIQSEYHVRAHIMAMDLTKPEAAGQIHAATEEAGIPIHILVNNAGVGTLGLFHEQDTRSQVDMVQLNVTALVNLTSLFLPAMVKRRSGHVLNIGSTAAFQPGPLMATYYATKAFVNSFSEALSHELRDTGVTMTAFCPGPTNTEFQKRAGTSQIKFYGADMAMSPQDVARQAYQAMMDEKRVAVAGIKNRILAMAAYHAPNTLTNRFVQKLNSDRSQK